jgi:hypothetical protein
MASSLLVINVNLLLLHVHAILCNYDTAEGSAECAMSAHLSKMGEMSRWA